MVWQVLLWMTKPEYQHFFPWVAVFFSGAAVDCVNQGQLGVVGEVFSISRGGVVEDK